MKKLSALLAAVMMFVMVATGLGNAQTVQAFPESEISWFDFERYESAKAGSDIYFSYNLPYDTAADQDITGWKGVLCPEGNVALSTAVVTVEFSNDDKHISEQFQYAAISKSTTIANDIPEGNYVKAIFDAAGNVVFSDELNVRPYVNKTLVWASCELINNDGYAYAYVYSESPSVNASTYPTFYAADKATAVTSFDNYITTTNDYGDTVHVYRLNILDASQFALDENGVTYIYYKMGTPILASGNDGGVGVGTIDANGFGWTNIRDLNKWVEKYGYDDIEIVDPFSNSSASAPVEEYVPVPVEQEVVLPGGEEARMINAGSPYVYVIGDPEVVPTGASFRNAPVIAGDGLTLPTAAVEKYVGAGLETAVYEMNLTAADGVAITQLGDYINVTLPIPASITLDEGKTIVMYRYEDNGTLTRCDTVVDGNMVTFATNHFSLYIMVEQDASAGPAVVRGTSGSSATATSPKTVDMSMIPAMMTAISGMGIAVVAMKKRNEI